MPRLAPMTRSFAMGLYPQISAIAALPKALRRSKVVILNLSPKSRMRRHEESSSLCVGLLVFVTVFDTHWVAEIVGMELRHHVHWRCWHALGNPFQSTFVHFGTISFARCCYCRRGGMGGSASLQSTPMFRQLSST